MFTSLRIRATMLALGTISCLSSCSKEEASPTVVQTTQDAKKAPATQQELKDAWDTFVQKVEKGEWKDSFKQYVSKDTRVESDGTSERPTRPKKDATAREFKRVTKRANNGDITTMLIPAEDPCPPDALECTGGGGGGGYTPPSSTFITTEMVQPYSSSPASLTAGTAMRTTGFYTTDNPNGYLYDIKIVKGTGAGEPPFHGSSYYHNINADLNSGAGGEYIYISFTRDPSRVYYQRYGSCGTNGDEQPRDASGNYINTPITSVDTRTTRVFGQTTKCYNNYTPMWAVIPGYTSLPSGNYMKFPDLNDGAGGSYVYGYQSRDPYKGSPIELGVLIGNSSSIQPPAGSGYTRVGEDLNEGAGGNYIYFCIKHRP